MPQDPQGWTPIKPQGSRDLASLAASGQQRELFFHFDFPAFPSLLALPLSEFLLIFFCFCFGVSFFPLIWRDDRT
jgi:hypothetical protein